MRPAWWQGGGLAATAIDEALLSALSLGLTLVLIHGSSKTEYGVFSLVSGLILLLRGAQNSLVLTPLATMGGRLQGDERASFVGAMSHVQTGLGVVLSIVVTLGMWIFSVGDGGWLLALGSGLALAGGWLREYRRGVALLEGKGATALAGDVLFAVLAAGTVLASWSLWDSVTAGGVLAATGLAAGTAAFLGFAVPTGGAPATGHRHVVRVALDQARWSLPGTAVAWGQGSGYAYVVGLMLGSAAVGEISAARLFVVPLFLVAVAWNRIFLPRAAAFLAEGGEAMLRARCVRAFRTALVGGTLYFLFLAAAFAVGLGRILPADYAHCDVQVLAWSGFAIVNLIRSIASNALIALLRFRTLFAMTVAAAAASLLSVVVLVVLLGATGAVIGLTAGELVMAGMCWRSLLAGRNR